MTANKPCNHPRTELSFSPPLGFGWSTNLVCYKCKSRWGVIDLFRFILLAYEKAKKEKKK